MNERRRRLIIWVVYPVFLVVVASALFDGTVDFLMDHPKILMAHYKYPYLNPFREYYENVDRRVIQYLPACARYDSQVSYTLRPGTCRFANREFDVEYRINSAGLRGDEASLHAPDLIVLGDSHAMGWGVEQDQTFAALIEQKTGMKVLNAAIASYGTVRELKLLGRLDVSKLKYVILTYADNDVIENKAYADNGNNLPIMSKDEYDRIVAAHVRTSRHFFGKHTYWAVSTLVGRLLGVASAAAAETQADQKADEVNLFWNVLVHAPVDLSHVKVIVIEINGYAGNSPDFITRLSAKVAASTSPAWIKNVIPVDLSRDLTVDDYYGLDEHMRAAGYRVVADKLLPLLATK